MIYKLISSREVVAKVFSDLDLKDEAQRITDIQEWISEAVEKIGAVSQLRRIVSGSNDEPYVGLSGYQASMPSNLYRLNGVMYSTSINGPWAQMKKSTGKFSMWPSVEAESDTGERLIKDQLLVETVKTLYQKYAEDPIYAWFSKMDNEEALNILNTNPNVRTVLTHLINAAGNNGIKSTEKGLMYTIKPGFIVTNIRDGYLKLSYDSMYTDEDGYLLIPDLVSYREAIFWYVVVKLKYPDYLAGRMNQEIYNSARRSWNFYCKQAYGDAMMPDQDDMENIKKVWNRLVPEMNLGDRTYDDLNVGETIYNKN